MNHIKAICLALIATAHGLAPVDLQAQRARPAEDGSSTAAVLQGNKLSNMSHMLVSVLYPESAEEQPRNMRARDTFFNGLRAWVNDDKDPKEYLNNAFGPYVAKALDLYRAKGQTISFDPQMTALDQALIIHDMSQRGDVPNLKKDYQGAGVHLHYVIDEAHRRDITSLLGSEELYNKIYPDVSARAQNPIVIDQVISSEEDIEALAEKFATDSVFIEEELPELREELARGAGFRYRYRVFDPSKPVHFAEAGQVLVQFEMRYANAYHPRSQDRSVSSVIIGSNGRGSRLFDRLSDVSDDHLYYNDRVVLSPSGALELQNRLTESMGSRMSQGADDFLRQAKREIYSIICEQ